MEKYVCTVCGWVYDPAVGDPEHGIKPGTSFADLPDDWTLTHRRSAFLLFQTIGPTGVLAR